MSSNAHGGLLDDLGGSLRQSLRVADPPDQRMGKPRAGVGSRMPEGQGKFKGLFRLRVGGYRVTYDKTARGYLVLKIGHRLETVTCRGG